MTAVSPATWSADRGEGPCIHHPGAVLVYNERAFASTRGVGMPGPEIVRRLIGREVDVDERSGMHHRGRLVNVNRRSLWLIEGDDDCFIPLADVADLRAAG